MGNDDSRSLQAVEPAQEAVEPEIVSGDGAARSAGPKVFVKVYRPGPLKMLAFSTLGVLGLAALFAFGFVALAVAAVAGLLWALVSPLARLFRR